MSWRIIFRWPPTPGWTMSSWPRLNGGVRPTASVRRQRAVLGYAEHLGAGAARDDAALEACFSPVEQTELTVTGATYIALARMLRALDVRIDAGLSG
ncbi:hypothetical protein O2L01_17770 [Glycomyces lechevalierae]|uniref:Alkylhydroperoxidase family enzyme n=1 Tax=Glycomyces lechevalierae TaxID=256034 RepID=A0A9X3SXC6_9ACTN|nr:hypothetical protein [Glycomyces lechevalierae]MDA1386852.1 hypothetical protein [Glycomyces lechevalierae]MDR7336347.1 alkylhydroperoxidase family enzyme [Glycomyces lechevalierae]